MAFLRTAIRCSALKKYGLLSDQTKINVGRTALKSTAATSTNIVGTSPKTVQQPPRDPLDITFEDAKAAFKSKTNLELIRAYVVYTLCSFDYLVQNNMKVGAFL